MCYVCFLLSLSLSLFIYIYLYINIYLLVIKQAIVCSNLSYYIYMIYIYDNEPVHEWMNKWIEREREREREREDKDRKKD